MVKSKVCKKCRLFVNGSQCPICKGTNFSNNFKGKVVILDPEQSEIAKKMNITQKGDYAIKVN